MKMKKVFVKSMAAISAVAMGIGSASQVLAFDESVLQNENTEEAIAQEQFLSTFEDENLREVASFCLDEGVSIDDTAQMMETYEEGVEEIEAQSEVISSPYYSTTNLCNTKHFIAVIAKNPDQGLDENFDLALKTSILTHVKNEYEVCFPYTRSSCETSASVTYPSKLNTSSLITIRTDLTANALSYTTAEPVLRYKITPTSSAKNESAVYGGITFTDRLSTGDLDYETYALGDVDHNGVVNSADYTYLMDFLLMKRDDFDFTYSDGSNHFSFATNGLAADTTQDNAVDIRDASQLNAYLNGNTNTLVD